LAITHLIDTDVCIKVLKKKNRELIRLFSSKLNHIVVSDISVFELYTGAEKYDDSLRRKAVLQDFLSRIPVLPFETAAARHAGEICGLLELRSQKLGAYDYLIAGIARSQGLVLATNNLREFNRVEGLKVEKWG
jgi:tRNA(fMet)-specific endonuclease VapC